MYTEISLFSNAVNLPAVMYNPVQGEKTFNQGSGFYYGFALVDSPDSFSIKTNIPSYSSKPDTRGLFAQWMAKDASAKLESTYSLSMKKDQLSLFLEVQPSAQMLSRKNIPLIYHRPESSAEMLAKKLSTKAAPLGEAFVNLALYFDLTKFDKGDQSISFKLFFDNQSKEETLAEFAGLKNWNYQLNPISLNPGLPASRP